jgi:hypothetical protein
MAYTMRDVSAEVWFETEQGSMAHQWVMFRTWSQGNFYRLVDRWARERGYSIIDVECGVYDAV